ncbi:MAG: cytochrome c-type biogenesis protein CcmH [Kyrpidia sp.]|nr:cytochrome c-type biogenesis protein CcmH [Kyrpidia sp.]
MTRACSQRRLGFPGHSNRSVLFRIMFWIVFLAASLGADLVWAAGRSVSWQEVLDLASEYHPPGCPPTLTAATCQEKQAYDLRLEILRLLEDGKSRPEIRQILVSEYGNDILSAPPPTGIGILVWAVPAAAVAAGLVVFVLIVRGRRPPSGG